MTTTNPFICSKYMNLIPIYILEAIPAKCVGARDSVTE